MKTNKDDVVRFLNRCFAKTTTIGMPFIERYITVEEKETGKRIRATYNC
jgi:hypothetical protein